MSLTSTTRPPALAEAVPAGGAAEKGSAAACCSTSFDRSPSVSHICAASRAADCAITPPTAVAIANPHTPAFAPTLISSLQARHSISARIKSLASPTCQPHFTYKNDFLHSFRTAAPHCRPRALCALIFLSVYPLNGSRFSPVGC